jgi:hypothetical protein
VLQVLRVPRLLPGHWRHLQARFRHKPHVGVAGIAGDTIEGARIPRGGPGVGPGGAVGACVQVREGAELGTRGEGSQCSRRQGYSDRDHDGTVIMGSLRKCKGACSSLSR